MAYIKWRNENINTLQRQQMLEAINSFKSFTIKNDINSHINPTVGKKCLKAMEKMKTNRMKKNSVTVSEILSLKDEISNIIVDDLFEDTLPEKPNELIHNETVNEVEESEEDDNTSDYGDISHKQDAINNAIFKGMFQKDNSLNQNVLGNFGKMTGDLMSSIMNPMLKTAVDVAKPYVKVILSTLKALIEDPSVPNEQKIFYEHAHSYYLEINKVYRQDLSFMEQAMMLEEISDKYDRQEIESILKNDPKLSHIMEKMLSEDGGDISEQLEEGMAKMSDMADQCTVS